MICQPKMLDGRTEILRQDARAIAEFIETRLARFPEEPLDLYGEILDATDFYFNKGERSFSEIGDLPPALLFEICRILNERPKIGDAFKLRDRYDLAQDRKEKGKGDADENLSALAAVGE